MSQMAHRPSYGARDQLVFAVVLIVVGVAGLASRVWQPTADVGGWVVALIGLGLLGAFAYTRRYGYLVPGSILTGLGLGIVASQSFTFVGGEAEGGAVVLGLGIGFIGIWALGTLVRIEGHHWWPLIPGGVLAAIGTALLADISLEVLDYWGFVLVAIGVIVFARAWMERRSGA